MYPVPESYNAATQGNTVLHQAALDGHAELAHQILNTEQELLVFQNKDGDTPLHLAAKMGRMEVAQLLIRHALAWAGAERSALTMTNLAGNNPLHEALRNRRVAVALAMLDADPMCGRDLNKQMQSPLHMAAREGLFPIVQRIVECPWVSQEPVPLHAWAEPC